MCIDDDTLPGWDAFVTNSRNGRVELGKHSPRVFEHYAPFTCLHRGERGRWFLSDELYPTQVFQYLNTSNRAHHVSRGWHSLVLKYSNILSRATSSSFLSVPAFMWNGVLKPRRTLQGDAETDSDDNGRYCAFASPAWLPQLFRSVCQHHHDHARLHRRSGNRRRPG